jgi:hypothetical protein
MVPNSKHVPNDKIPSILAVGDVVDYYVNFVFNLGAKVACVGLQQDEVKLTKCLSVDPGTFKELESLFLKRPDSISQSEAGQCGPLGWTLGSSRGGKGCFTILFTIGGGGIHDEKMMWLGGKYGKIQ